MVAIAGCLGVADARAQGPGTLLQDLPVSRLERLDAAPAQPRTVPVTRISDRTDLDGPRTLSLTFPKPAPVRDVLLLLVRGTSVSAVLDGSVTGTFTGELRGLTLRQALEAVLFSSNLEYELRGTVVRVFPRRPRTRLFGVYLIPVRRVWSARSGTLHASSGESDPFGDLDAGVRALLSQQGRHHLDRRAGLMSVTDFADRLDQIGLYLETAHLRATRQVRIDARVLQVALNEEAWGIDLAAVAAGGGGIREAASASAGFVMSDYGAFLRALGQWGQVTSAGAPRVLATNNEPAVVRVVTGSRAGPESGAASDLSLTVTPQISADGIVQLSLTARYAKAAAAPDALSIGEVDTLVRVRAGETVILSGLQHPAEAVVGARRTELVVLLTPTIVSPALPSQAGER
jgi:type II secretory pathway component GspD/PulD (secretin)